MLRARLAPLALATVAAAGCAEDPSFWVRWRLQPPEQAEAAELVSVDQCTELGISGIRVSTRDQGNALLDEREFPCFPSGFEDRDARAPGPEVGAGTYSVTVTALGRRAVQFCADEPAPAADTDGSEADTSCKKVLASVAQDVVIREAGEGKPLDVVIVGAPQCSDGIDNDRDGYTDLADPSCAGDRAGFELGDSAGAQVVVRPQLMSGNPSAYCDGLGLSQIELAITGPTAKKLRFTCTTTAQTFTESLDPGDYTLSVTGLDAKGKVLAVPTLDPDLVNFTLAPEGFRSVDLPADFTIASFLAPIEAGFEFSLALLSGPEQQPLTTCEPEPGLVIDRVRLTVLGPDLELVPTAALHDGANPPIVLDGVTTVPCTLLGGLPRIEPLVWDDAPMAHEELYLRVEAFAVGSDVPCYGNGDEPVPAAPNASLAIELPRVASDGACAEPTNP
ncbi:hypothetical protein SAMN02745121_06902 [Nannocystis exedens]|uniref:Uncharacterized protein n=1 Tax=Nannocystis exedens TaxID=54 RepID=A0A1I2FX75_9BACT|nr:hypothetical protein [Nannocystis exedens]PCC74537.1 hypothetical protein NAEX_07633 [Nannocystis exedens]SFF10024.1 hypothetical protein SAMN02745121_06902 [Nannocystis exedens]